MAEKKKFTGPELKEAVQKIELMARDAVNPIDISLAEYAKEVLSYGDVLDLYEAMDINPATATVSNIMQMPDDGYRWLIPVIYRDALRLGLRRAPIYGDLIAAEQTVSQKSITMPAVNMSDAAPSLVGTAETITVGEVSFSEKTVKIHKIGKGIKLPYEIAQYVSLNLVSIFLEDFGVKLGMGIDTLCLHTALNGDQLDGSDSCPVIGINDVADGIVYRDLLKPFVRMSRLGKLPNKMIAGENTAIDVLDMITTAVVPAGSQRMGINLKTPLPQKSDLYVHGKIGDNQLLIIDPKSCMVKLNAQPILVESDKIISNQTTETYVSLTTGFATMYRDSRIIADKSLAFAENGFPAFMDPTAQEVINF